MNQARAAECAIARLSSHLVRMLPQERVQLLTVLLSFYPSQRLHESFDIGELRALVAEYWEHEFAELVPIQGLREMTEGASVVAIDHFADVSGACNESELRAALLGTLHSLRRFSLGRHAVGEVQR